MPEEREVEVASARKRGGKRQGRAYDSLLDGPLPPRRPLGPELPPQISDEEIYAPLGEARRQIEVAEEWSALVHVGAGELEKSGVVVESGWTFGTDDDIAKLHERLAAGKLEPDDELMAAAHLDANRLRSAAQSDPRWWRMILTWQLTLMVERFRPSSDREAEIRRRAENYVYANAETWFRASADRGARNIFTAMQTMTTPVVMVNDQPFIYPGELLDAVRHLEMRDLMNRLIVAAWPLLFIGSIARHMPIFSTLIDLSLDPGGTASGWWHMITHPGETWDKMMKAKEEHGWNFINPLYWSMVHFYEAGESFRRYRETNDPSHALEGLDRMGQGFGAAVDTVGVATGIGAAVTGPRVVATAADQAQEAVETANKARRAAARADRAKDALSEAFEDLAVHTSRLSANPYLDPVFLKKMAVVAYELARTGITTFDAFIKAVKLKRLKAFRDIDLDSLTPEELAALQQAFATGLRRQQSIPVVGGVRMAPKEAAENYYRWENRSDIGAGDSIAASLDEQGTLRVRVRSKGPKERRRGGPRMLDDVFQYFGDDQIKRFEAIWSTQEPYTRNYNEFMKLIGEGKSAVDAAWGTWTGQQLKARGFTRVEIEDVTPGSQPAGVAPMFYKDGEPNVP